MDTQLRIAGIINESIVDGPGIRLVVFAQGCKHNCPGCHNPETHSFTGGTLVSIGSIIEDIRENPILDGITLSGGDPFEQAESFSELAHRVKAIGLNVITYTGYTYEELLHGSIKNTAWWKMLNETDTLVEGRFQLDKKNFLLKFRGSENQRIIDLAASRVNNEVVLAGS